MVLCRCRMKSGQFGFTLAPLDPFLRYLHTCPCAGLKLIDDFDSVQEHIRQSRESKLDELGRHSTKLTKSRENIALEQLTKLPPPAFDPDSPSSFNEGQPTNHHFYRDTMPSGNGARILDSKNDLNLREQEIKNILGSSYDDERKDSDAMCDMACQTRWVINQFWISFASHFCRSSRASSLRPPQGLCFIMIDG